MAHELRMLTRDRTRGRNSISFFLRSERTRTTPMFPTIIKLENTKALLIFFLTPVSIKVTCNYSKIKFHLLALYFRIHEANNTL